MVLFRNKLHLWTLHYLSQSPHLKPAACSAAHLYIRLAACAACAATKKVNQIWWQLATTATLLYDRDRPNNALTSHIQYVCVLVAKGEHTHSHKNTLGRAAIFVRIWGSSMWVKPDEKHCGKGARLTSQRCQTCLMRSSELPGFPREEKQSKARGNAAPSRDQPSKIDIKGFILCCLCDSMRNFNFE